MYDKGKVLDERKGGVGKRRGEVIEVYTEGDLSEGTEKGGGGDTKVSRDKMK